MKIVDPVWPGFLESLFAATRCEVSGERRLGAVRLTWDTNGRPTAASIDRMELSPACASAVGALAVVNQADADRVVATGMEQWLLLPVSAGFAECAGNHVASRPTVVLPANLGRTPRKVRDARPVIPRNQWRQATTVLDATISANGCVASAELLSGNAVAFSVESFRAALAWAYEPPRLQGQAVAVDMPLTFSFTLN